jgi:hypothetical protein
MRWGGVQRGTSQKPSKTTNGFKKAVVLFLRLVRPKMLYLDGEGYTLLKSVTITASQHRRK